MGKRILQVLIMAVSLFIGSMANAQAPTPRIAVKPETTIKMKTQVGSTGKQEKSNPGSKTGNAANSSGDNSPVNGGDENGGGTGNGDSGGLKNGGGGNGGENGGGGNPSKGISTNATNVMQNNDNPAVAKIKTGNALKTKTQAPAVNQKAKLGGKN